MEMKPDNISVSKAFSSLKGNNQLILIFYLPWQDHLILTQLILQTIADYYFVSQSNYITPLKEYTTALECNLMA